MSYLNARYGPVRSFSLLRVLSGLKLRLPDDLALVPLLSDKEKALLNRHFGPHGEEGTAGTSRWFQVPDFSEILSVTDRVRCFMLCRKHTSRREVADLLGWSEDRVRKTDETLCKRLRSLKGVAW